ncbi:galactokinase [Nocardioides ginsengisegetis]
MHVAGIYGSPDTPRVVAVTFVEPGAPGQLAAAVREGFAASYGAPATVVGRAPGRVNLIGEHTDYNAGLVLPLALPHATYAAVALREDDRVRIGSRQKPQPWVATLDTIGPGQTDGWAAYVAGVLWALREAGWQTPGVDVYVDGTVPLGAGLSSSAALECSFAVALATLLGKDLTQAGRRTLIEACIRAETEVAGAPTGGMDQTVSMLAEPNAALLIDFDLQTAGPVALRLPEHGLAVLVTDTRVSHALTDGGYAARRADCEAAASALGVASLRHAGIAEVESQLTNDRVRRRARHIVTEIDRVAETVEAIRAGDWLSVGSLFLASHVSMRDDFEISCAELDLAVETALGAGAIGARMTGGGFGGSAIALVPLDRIDGVAGAIDAAFIAAGFRPPNHLLGEPSAAADVVTENGLARSS